jgi:hypothetical protein
MDQVQNPVIPSVIHRRQNPTDSFVLCELVFTLVYRGTLSVLRHFEVYLMCGCALDHTLILVLRNVEFVAANTEVPSSSPGAARFC